MNPQRRSHQIQPRGLRRQPQTAKVSVPLKLAQPSYIIRVLLMMPSHPNPIIQPLQREMKILIRLQLNHRQPSVIRHAQQVEHTAVRRRKRRHLRINMRRIKMCIERPLHLAAAHSQPPLRLHPVERIALAPHRQRAAQTAATPAPSAPPHSRPSAESHSHPRQT